MKVENRNEKLCAIRYVLFAVAAGLLLAAAAGCEDSGAQMFSNSERIQKLKEEKRQLQNQIEQAKVENEQLKEQVQLLSELPADVRLENVYDLKKIKLTRYTGFYDKDKDGRLEKLIVYIQPIDEDNDIIKATGAVDVQLWNLSRPEEQALLGEWHVGPEELKKEWFATLVTINYRLVFDVSGMIEGIEDDLTAKVTFTDYLSGKVFKEQKVVEPR